MRPQRDMAPLEHRFTRLDFVRSLRTCTTRMLCIESLEPASLTMNQQMLRSA